MNKQLYRAKLKEIRDAAKDPAGAAGVHASGKKWHTTPNNATYFEIKLKGDDGTLKIIFQRWNLYVQGFTSSKGSFKFTDATWNIAAGNIGFASDYRSMGWDRLSAYKGFSVDDINMAINNIMNCSTATQWAAQKQSIVKLVIAFAEGSRMHSIQQLIENGSDIPDVDWNARVNELALVKG